MQDQSNETLNTNSSTQNNNPVIVQTTNLGGDSSPQAEILDVIPTPPSIEPLQDTVSTNFGEVLEEKNPEPSLQGPIVFDPSSLGGNLSSTSTSNVSSGSTVPTLEPVVVKPNVEELNSPTVGGPSPSLNSNIPVVTPPTVAPTPVVTPTPVVPSNSGNNVSAAVPRDSIGTISLNKEPNPNGANPIPRENPVENLKKVEVEYKPPGKFKTFVLIVFFVGLILFVMFLPQIKDYVEEFQNRGKTQEIVKITTGSLRCSLKTNTKTLDKNYDLVFYFTDNKLEKTEFTITTKGDPTADEEELNQLEASCKLLESESENLDGFYVKCNNKTGMLTEIQNYDLSKLDLNQLNSAFVEAGANNPEYQYGQDMDKLEQTMNASGYTCKREG